MAIFPSSIANGVGITVKNERLVAAGSVRPSVIGIIGSYDPALTVTEEVPQLILNEGDAANRYGYGFPLHKLAQYAMKLSGGLPVYAIPQAETGTAAQGDITFSGTATKAGTLYVRIGGELIARVAVAKGDLHTDVSAAVDAAINAERESMVDSSEAAGVCTLDSKAKTTWGNYITVSLNSGDGEIDEYPAGIADVITPLANGTTVPDVDDALAGLGSGDAKNAIGITHMAHAYHSDATTITAIGTYVGLGDTGTGLFEDIIGRPFQTFMGDVQSGSAGLTAIRAIGDANKTDRTNVLVCAPTSESHPSLIAAYACGICAKVANATPLVNPTKIALPAINPGTVTDRWTDDYLNKDLAKKSGCSTTIFEDGVLKLQDMVTFYHPDSVPIISNGYRRVADAGALIPNMLRDQHNEFGSDFWQGKGIVADKSKVRNILQAQNVRDKSDVEASLFAIVAFWETMGYLFDADYSRDYIKTGNAVTIKAGGNGFDYSFPVVLRGTTDIMEGLLKFDVALTVFLQ